MPSCFHSLKQMCFPDGLHKGFVSSFVDEWWWWYLEEYYSFLLKAQVCCLSLKLLLGICWLTVVVKNNQRFLS